LSGNTQSVLQLQGIKNIIFDLGGVIINLSQEKTLQSFATLSGKPLVEIEEIVRKSSFFHLYEKGMITDNEFRSHLRASLNLTVNDELLDHAWNAMLLDLPLARIHLLEKLKGDYKLFLLSNTNNIHLQCFNQYVSRLTGYSSLDRYFHQAYYSHLIKMRKPDEEIYNYVLQNNNLNSVETLFLDDNTDNLAGANKSGIRTIHVHQPDVIFSIFQ